MESALEGMQQILMGSDRIAQSAPHLLLQINLCDMRTDPTSPNATVQRGDTAYPKDLDGLGVVAIIMLLVVVPPIIIMLLVVVPPIIIILFEVVLPPIIIMLFAAVVVVV